MRLQVRCLKVMQRPCWNLWTLCAIYPVTRCCGQVSEAVASTGALIGFVVVAVSWLLKYSTRMHSEKSQTTTETCNVEKRKTASCLNLTKKQFRLLDCELQADGFCCDVGWMFPYLDVQRRCLYLSHFNSSRVPTEEHLHPKRCMFQSMQARYIFGNFNYVFGGDEISYLTCFCVKLLPAGGQIWTNAVSATSGHEYSLSNLRFASHLEPLNPSVQTKLTEVEEKRRLRQSVVSCNVTSSSACINDQSQVFFAFNLTAA